MDMRRSISSSARAEGDLPLSGYVRLYETQLRSERKSPKTLRIYLYAIDQFRKWFTQQFVNEPFLSDYTAEQVRLYLVAAQVKPKFENHPFNPVQTNHISAATLHQFVRSLKTFGAWLARESYAERHPLETVRLPRLEEKQLVPLTEEEERVLLAAYNDNNPTECRIKAIMVLMLDTGLRAGEVIELRDRNVDLDNGFLMVMGKGRKERSVPFGFTTEKVLRKYAVFFRAAPALPSVDNFYLSFDGYPLTYSAIKMMFQRARQRTEIKRLHPHLLRHTYGIRAQENDMPTITLQHYMGHSSSTVTERYAHAAQSERLKRARGYSPIDQLRVRVAPLRLTQANGRRRNDGIPGDVRSKRRTTRRY